MQLQADSLYPFPLQPALAAKASVCFINILFSVLLWVESVNLNSLHGHFWTEVGRYFFI